MALRKVVYVNNDGSLYYEADLAGTGDDTPEVGEHLGKYELVSEGKYEATFVPNKKASK